MLRKSGVESFFICVKFKSGPWHPYFTGTLSAQAMDCRPRSADWVAETFGVNDGVDSGFEGIAFVLEPEEQPELLRFAARRGVPGLTLVNLHTLWHKLDVVVEGRKPTLLKEVLRAIVEHALGPQTDEQRAAILARREEYTHKPLWDSVVGDNPELATNLADDHDKPAIEDITKAVADRKPRENKKLAPSPPAARRLVLAKRAAPQMRPWASLSTMAASARPRARKLPRAQARRR